MTIHSGHPFADPEPDPVRRFRGRLGAAVTLWTAGSAAGRAGLTVTSVMVAGGRPGRLLALLDPDADLTAALEETGRGVVHVLAWHHRGLADAFAGTAPAPGGPFRTGDFRETDHGPRLLDATARADVTLEDARDVGWSRLVTCTIDGVDLDEEEGVPPDGPDAPPPDRAPLLHRRGRWLRP